MRIERASTAGAALLAALLAGALATTGCGAPGPHRHLDPLFESERARKAAELAPDLVAAARNAREDAARAHREGDDAAAADHATRARLLLDAAFAEAERITLSRKRQQVEAKARRVTEAAVHDERVRMAVVHAVERELAARVAEEQAARAFEVAADVETRRARARGDEAQRTHRRAAEALAERAKLVLATARALGAPAEQVDALEERLGELEPAGAPTEAVREADALLREARAVLGRARETGDGPTADEVASLLAEAKEAGLEPVRLERGLALGGELVSARGRPNGALLTQLAGLLAAHPFGPARIETGTSGGRAAERRAERRGRAVKQALVERDVSEDRLEVATVDGEGVAVLLPAY